MCSRNYLVRKYGGDKYVKQFTCYNQLAVLMSGRLSTAKAFVMLSWQLRHMHLKHTISIFDRGYDDFKRLHNINYVGAYYVVRGKKNNDFKPVKWTRRFPPGSGILSDYVG